MTDAGSLRVELFEERSKIPLAAGEWNALAERSQTSTVFQTYEWFDVWWRTFGAHRRLFFIIVRSAGEIIGFAPLMIRRGITGAAQLELIGTGNADYQDFILPTRTAEAMDAICALLRERSNTWFRAWLGNVPAESSTLQLLQRCGGPSDLHVVEETRVACPTLRLEGREEAAKRLVGKYSMRRPLNWFARHGELRFRHLTERGEIDALLPCFFDQHMRRRRAAGGRSLFEGAEQRTFYQDLAHAALTAGWLQFSVVELDREPIAFHFGFDYRRTITWYKPSFEPRYAHHSPGLLLIQQLIEDGLRRGRREIDFTIGDETFKQRFANQHRANLYLGVYRSRGAYAAALAVRNSRRLAGRMLRALSRRSDSEAAERSHPVTSTNGSS